MWQTEENLQELAVALYHVDPGDYTKAFGLEVSLPVEPPFWLLFPTCKLLDLL